MCDLPIYSGFAILELSKLIMFDFHYKYIRPKYGKKARLLFTDTDSLAYEIETNDIYADMAGDSDKFDTSNYPKEHYLYSEKNKQVLGKFKDELAGEPMKEFIGLRSKMYSMTSTNTEKQRAKGIDKTFTKNHLRHEAYKSALINNTIEKGSWVKINSRAHQITSDRVTKSLLNPYDDKRFLVDNTTTYAHGHYLYNPKEMEDTFDPDLDVESDAEELEQGTYEKKENSKDFIRLERMNSREKEEKKKEYKSWQLQKLHKKRDAMSEEMKEAIKLEKKMRERKRTAEMSEEMKAESKKNKAARKKKRRAELTEEQKNAAKAKRRQMYLEKKQKKAVKK